MRESNSPNTEAIKAAEFHVCKKFDAARVRNTFGRLHALHDNITLYSTSTTFQHFNKHVRRDLSTKRVRITVPLERRKRQQENRKSLIVAAAAAAFCCDLYVALVVP